jgi:NNP family nitrate/nitrite transporter-like MFS transporter
MKAGHFPTLLAAFFYFDMSFMVWVLLGALAVQMSAEIGLNAAQKGFMVALPVLAGALLRVVFGILVDRRRWKFRHRVRFAVRAGAGCRARLE